MSAVQVKVKLKLIWFMGLCGMLAIFSSTLSKNPTLPLFASQLGATDAQIGWIAAASTLPGILLSYLAGTVSDRYGTRKILLIALVIFATAPILYLLVQDPVGLAAVRFYHGFATAIFGPVAMAATVNLSGERKGEMLSFYSSATMAGRAGAPFAGGILLASWGFNSVFLVCLFSGITALLFGMLLLREPVNSSDSDTYTGKEAKEKLDLLKNIQCLLCNRTFLMVGLIEACMFFAYGAFEVFFPLYAIGIGISLWQIGLIMGLQLAGVIFLKPVFGRLSDKIGRFPVIFSGLLLCAVSVSIIAYTYQVILIGLLNIAFGLGFALVTASSRPLAVDVVAKEHRGGSLGMLGTLMDLGQIAGPLTIGVIAGLYGYRMGFVLLSIFLLVVTLMVYIFKEKQLRSEKQG